MGTFCTPLYTLHPVVVIEAKSWDSPFVSASNRKDRSTEPQLIISGLEHIKSGNTKDTSPVTGQWHDFLKQIFEYTTNLKNIHGYELSRVVLTSGQWTLVFINPTQIFSSGDRITDTDFVIFRKESLFSHAKRLFDLLCRDLLVNELPAPLRPAQLPTYLSAGDVQYYFHGVHVVYEESGTILRDRKPRILIYPVIVFQRLDNSLITVLGSDEFILGSYDGSLKRHLFQVFESAETLVAECKKFVTFSAATASSLDLFPGFADGEFDSTYRFGRRLVSQNFKSPDHFIVITGKDTHFLLDQSTNCHFHEWGECRVVGKALGSSAISSSSLDHPKSFFIDGEDYHCAHQDLDDLKDRKCYIRPIDERLCCRQCIFQSTCWAPDQVGKMPCGGA